MKLNRHMAIATLVLTSGFAAPAWSQGTPQQRSACIPDVFRLCSSFIPDPERITACLVERRQELSQACTSVMSGGASSSTTSGEPRREAYSEPTQSSR
jgi:hypothetical protein